MERRKEPRFEADQPVRVTLLGSGCEPLTGRLLNFSGAGLRLGLDVPVAAGTALEIEWDQTLLLAEVCYCLEGAGAFVLGLKLEHCLLETDEIARLARALMGETAVATPHP